jgi:hypothetical protein
MTIYTLENESGNITAFATAEAAAAASTTPFDVITNQHELAELIAPWPAARLLTTYNSLPGVKPLKSLKDPKTAAGKIWERVEKLGRIVEPQSEATKPETAAAKPKADKKAKGGTPGAKRTTPKGKATKKATPGKPVPKGKKGAKQQDAKPETGAPREGS